MRRGRRDVIRGLASALIVASFAGPGSSRVNAAPAAWQPAADWYSAGLTGRVTDMFTPASGAVYAVQRRAGAREIVPTDGVQGDEGLWWSTDGRRDWRRIALPPGAERVWVDPVHDATIYAHASPTLYKTADRGESWTPLVLTSFPQTDSEVHVGILAISPADHHVLHALAWNGSARLLLRSHDGGLTWEPTSDNLNAGATTVPLMLPHGLDAGRVLRVAGDSRVDGDLAGVEVSEDQGTTWERHGAPGIASLPTSITGLVGFQGKNPERLYATTRSKEIASDGQAARFVGSSVFRSDDEGRTWAQVLSTVKAGEEEQTPSISGIAYDTRLPGLVGVTMGSQVLLSTRDGNAWSRWGRRELPTISALALHARGNPMYAATEAGLFYANMPV
jgi:photosystem II stability/assembly factor-like uncharacterized protein